MTGRPPRLVLNALRFANVISIWSTEPLDDSSPWAALRRKDEPDKPLPADLRQLSPTRWRWQAADVLDCSEVVVGGTTELGQSAVTSVVNLADPSTRILPTPLLPDPIHPNSITEYGEFFARSCVLRSTGDAPEQDSLRQAKRLLRDRTKAGMSVLDVGCASGHAWRSLRELDIEYYGIDSYTRAIEIGRLILGAQGLPLDRLRNIPLEDLPPDERYDVVLSLSTLLYFPMFQEPLALMSRAAREWIVIRSCFGDRTEVRYLPDILLEPGYERLHAYFNIFSRTEVASFLEGRGFEVEWHADRRQAQRFGGRAETVGGIDLPYEFLVAKRVRAAEDVERLDDHFSKALSDWRDRGGGGPSL